MPDFVQKINLPQPEMLTGFEIVSHLVSIYSYGYLKYLRQWKNHSNPEIIESQLSQSLKINSLKTGIISS